MLANTEVCMADLLPGGEDDDGDEEDEDDD
jgi:hypothetical protein